jgi:hypothetical protein
MMFRHMAILKFRPDAPEAARQRFADNFPRMANGIPQIRAWTFGRNTGPGGESHVRAGGYAPNYDVGLTMDFDDSAGYLAYAESESHRRFFAEFVAPILAERVVVQFPLP